ncbi:ABC transporter substrate-binding protein [Heyndrickxia shackletonii]|uniref:ABC transporter substrate-binding protein n=1 Tax=Heyndrickxia shackletonii TaxID=157838 RepID=A0A0Q3T8V0_9BACI|nr:peptide ABC transporter substrate-binding protein [Heyndrickxia shackletonii]KQL50414.1 ABC transporter substrate-binding protein [Heyndrickxia shackletonii]NEZ00878.1 peptide ABC transporter substrate-binding protein [Heyndrickxia shackletonii]
MRKAWISSVSLVVLLTLILSGCGGFTSSNGNGGTEKAKDSVLNLALESDIPDLNQVKTTDGTSFTILNNTLEGLYRLDQDNQPQPAMAKSVDISDDKLTYTFHLRDGIKWSNGDPVTAADFKYSWLKALDPNTASQYAFIIAQFVKGAADYNAGKADASAVAVEAKDDKTLVVTLNQPTPFFLSLTAFVTYFPLNQKFVEKVGFDKFALTADSILYNGPYVITSYDQAKGVTLKKNDKYWDKKNVQVQTVNMDVLKEASTALNLYESGKLDKVYLQSSDVNSYKDKEGFGTETMFRTYFTQANLKKKPFDNQKIRKAFQLAVEPKILTDTILNNGSLPGTGLVPAGMNGTDGKTYRELAGDVFKPDVAKAKELLAEGIKESGKLPKIELLVSDDSVSKDTATFLQSEYKKNLGVDVSIVTKPFSGRLEAMRNGDFTLAVNRWGADYNDPLTFMYEWVDPKTQSRGNYNNKEYNALVDGAQVEKDENKRIDMFVQAEKLLIEDGNMTPLYFDGRAYMINPKVKGLKIAPGATLELKYVKIDK